MSTVLLKRTFLLVCIACISTPALAAIVSWTGGGSDSNWGTGANWNSGTVPTSADEVRIPSGAVEIPAGESYSHGAGSFGHYGGVSSLYIAPGATLNSGGTVFISREAGSSTFTAEVDGTWNNPGQRFTFCGGQNANGTLIVNEGGYAECGLMLFGDWGSGTRQGKLILNGGTIKNDQLGAYESKCQVTLDLNDGLFDTGYLNPAVLALYDSPTGSLNVDIDFATWIINGNRTTDVQTMIDRGELVGFGGKGTIVYDYNETTPGRTTVTAINPLNPFPEYNGIILTTGGSGTVTLEWDNYIDPNHVGATMNADVWFGTDPNKLNPAVYSKAVDGMIVTTGTRSSSAPQPIVAGQTYYWQVDIDNGSGSTIEGAVLKFLVIDNAKPEISIKNVSSWLDEVTGKAVILMDATVVDDTTGITYAWTVDPADDPDVVFDNAAIEDPTLTISSTGVRTLTLTVNDGYWEESAQCQVGVYANSCQAARQSPGYAGDPAGDITGNCVVDLADFAALAQSWLEDSTLTETLYY